MYISFVNKIDSSRQTLIESAVVFFADYLISKRCCKTLEIDIHITNSTADGFCEYNDSNINPRSFTIELDKNLTGSELIKTIAHEMVHVKQYVKGELKERYKPRYHHLWYNKKVTVNDNNYNDVPWEVEARNFEIKLFNIYTCKYGIPT